MCCYFSFSFIVSVWLNPEKQEHDVTGRSRYVKVCNDLGVTPVTSYLESLKQKEISLKFYGLSITSAKAISVPLEVSNFFLYEGDLFI